MAELAHDHSYPFALNRLSKPAGAEICGLDLTKPLDDVTRDALIIALLENHVLAIRDQDLTSDQQMAVTACFGKPETHVFHDATGSKGPKISSCIHVGNLLISTKSDLLELPCPMLINVG